MIEGTGRKKKKCKDELKMCVYFFEWLNKLNAENDFGHILMRGKTRKFSCPLFHNIFKLNFFKYFNGLINMVMKCTYNYENLRQFLKLSIATTITIKPLHKKQRKMYHVGDSFIKLFLDKCPLDHAITRTIAII